VTTSGGTGQAAGGGALVAAGASAARRVRVLVVDDSAVVRQVLSRELSKDPGIEVVGAAADPYAARAMIVALRPDVLTLDVEMPRMDGITFLHKLMAARPMPVVVVSSLTTAGTRAAVDALAAGAVDVVCKPGSAYEVDGMAAAVAAKVRAAARARPQAAARPAASGGAAVPGATAPGAALSHTTHQVLAIGASTGGVQALSELLAAFPADAPGTVVVQHMPPKFTASFADRLRRSCAVDVREAQAGDPVTPGRVLIAPGGLHTVLRRSGATYLVDVRDGPPVYYQKPSVDVLFESVARAAGRNAVGALLTGMGADGASGLLSMRAAGAHTIAQDEATSVVWGMPGEAVKLGAAAEVLPLGRVAAALIRRAAAAA
jgi:two-component system chemotaxis response regulator CheB